MKRKMTFTIKPSSLRTTTKITVETSGDGSNYSSLDITNHFRRITGGLFGTIVQMFEVDEIAKKEK
jgi:hypothetical protein